MVKFALTENKKITISADIWIFGLACLLEMGSKAIALSKVLSFLAEGIPSIGTSPFSCGWSTYEKNVRGLQKDCCFTICTNNGGLFFIFRFFHFWRFCPLFLLSYLLQITSADLAAVAKAIDSGFIPVSLNYLIYDNNTSQSLKL